MIGQVRTAIEKTKRNIGATAARVRKKSMTVARDLIAEELSGYATLLKPLAEISSPDGKKLIFPLKNLRDFATKGREAALSQYEKIEEISGMNTPVSGYITVGDIKRHKPQLWKDIKSGRVRPEDVRPWHVFRGECAVRKCSSPEFNGGYCQYHQQFVPDYERVTIFRAGLNDKKTRITVH